MIRASVNLQKPLYKWYEANLGSTSAEVIIGNGDKYQLGRIRRLGSSNLFFELRDSDGDILQQWELQYKWNGSASLQISSAVEYPIVYHVSLFGRASFRTTTAKFPVFLNLSGSSRTFRLGEMKFQHQDYQSSISVSSPSEQIYSAILIADLLYNYPHQNDST